MRRSRFLAWSDLRAANLAVLLLNTTDSFSVTLFSAYLKSLGYEVAEIGVMVALFAVTSLFARIPAGQAADGARARLWFTIACGLLVISLGGYAIAATPVLLVVARLVHGFASGTAGTLNFAAFLGIASGRDRARLTAMYTAAMSGGYALGNTVSGYAADYLGYTVAFAIAALCPLGALAAGLSMTLRPSVEPDGRAARSSFDWRIALRPEIASIPVLAFMVNVTHQTLGTLFPLYMLAVGQTVSLVGVVRGVQSLANTIVRPLGEPLLRLFGVAGLAILGVAVNSLGVAAIPFFTAPLVMVVLFAVIGAGRGSAIVANHLAASELSAQGHLKPGAASTLVSVGNDAGAVLAPVVAGLAAAQVGIGTTMQVIPLIAGALGIAAMLMSRRTANSY